MFKQTMDDVISIAAMAEESGVRFGTSGARGLVVSMTDRVCWAYTAAFLQEIVPTATRVALGCDLRSSSPEIAQACAAAIQAAGMKVEFAGILPTPALAYYALQQAIPAIMVTGSHIPFDRNGIKFYTATGEINKSHEAAISHAVVPDPGSAIVANFSASVPALDEYQERYLNFFPENFLQGLRIGVYEHSSVARDFLPKLLRQFGAEVISLGRTNDFVPVDTEAVSEADQIMASAWALEHGLDALLSTDGDADRPLIGDEKGHWLRGDVVGLLCAQYLGASTVAIPVSCTTSIERCEAFSNVIRTKIGSPYVINAMDLALSEARQGVVGFEANGGFLVGDSFVRNNRQLQPLPTRDAVLPMLALLALAKERGVPLSNLESSLPRRFTASDRIKDYPTERSSALIAKLLSSSQALNQLLGDFSGDLLAVDETDGLRMRFSSEEIIHLRPSGNAPELRCYAEADSDARANEVVKFVLDRCHNDVE